MDEDYLEKVLLEGLPCGSPEGTGVKVFKLCHLKEVKKQGAKILSLTMENGLEVQAKQFIDATYEGDLLARAGVSWHAGREANTVYGESYNGIRAPGTGGHNWPKSIDPYRIAGDPSSELLPRVNSKPGEPGQGDGRIQAFCFRMRLTKDNPQPFPKPSGYREEEYELLARLFESGANPHIQFSIDTNNHHLFKGAYFIDYVGGNYDWPNASWLERERIYQDHVNYQIGVMWFLTHSDRVPEPYRSELRKWGLPRDEYQDTGGWTHQLYIREGRRMVSDYVMTQANCQGLKVPKDSVGLASYNMDSHHCQMTVNEGAVRNEGNVEIPVEPYPIAYRALTPKRSQCTNLLVPVALSSSHIAFGSIRMEPVFMLLGQSAATASCLAIDGDVPVQDVSYPKLQKQLLKDGQILEYTGPPRHRRTGQTGIDAQSLEGLVIDNEAAELKGPWQVNNVTHPRIGKNYLHDNNEAKGKCLASYKFQLPKPGQYEVRLSWPTNANRATNVPVTIHYKAGQQKTVNVDQKQAGKLDGALTSLGEFEFDKTAIIEISNRETNGYVIADAVQLLPVNPMPAKKKSVQKAGPNAPNILVLFADDLGYESLGCYGGKDFSTPNLDRLAKQGIRFRRAYTSPVCTPSRMSLYTGEYVTRHGYDHVLPVHVGTKQAVDFRRRFTTFPQVLRDAGYTTSVTGKWQLAALEFHPDHCRDAGFDSWCVWQIWRNGAKTTRYWNPCFNHDGKIRAEISERFGPDVLADYVIEQMKSAVDQKRPFFIQHNMLLPHEPIIKTPAENASGQPASLGRMITYLDTICGRIIGAIEQMGIAENTYIIFMGDNGTDSATPRRTIAGLVKGGKRDLNDAGTHIPLIIRRPGTIKAGSIADDLIDMTDLFPTICELAGLHVPDNHAPDGVSFAGRLLQGKPSLRTFVTGGISKHTSVFDGNWRLDSKQKTLIDSRNLPAEISLDDAPPEHQTEWTKLQKVLKEIQLSN